MTAVNIVITDRAAHVVTDGAATRKDGTIGYIGNKVYSAPHMRAVFALRGYGVLLDSIGPSLSNYRTTFDEVAQGAWVPGIMSAYRGTGADEDFDLYVAGWSEERDQPEAYWLSTRVAPELVQMPVNALFSPGTPETTRVSREVLFLGDDDETFCKAMVTIMETQRQTSTDEHRIIGGFVQLTTITKEQTTQRILHRWPDKVGERIEGERAYHMLGGDDAALQIVATRAGMVPPSVAKQMRGDLNSNNVGRAEATLTRASNLMANQPNIFAATDGREEIENNALAFRHFVEDLGFTSKEAAQRVVEMNNPEHKAKVQARIKSEDLNAIVKKNLKVSDLEFAFDPTYWFQDFFRRMDDSSASYRPTLAVNPEARRAMFGDYEELFREHYLATGDINASKSLAQNQLKRVWGVSAVNGTETVMRYPIDRAPAFARVENASEKIAADILQSIKDETGQTVERSKLMVLPVPGGQTSQAYWAGRPPPYQVMWQDANGLVHSLNPGRAYVADVRKMQEAQSAERERLFMDARVASAAAEPRQNRRTGRMTAENFPDGGARLPTIAEAGE